jgi:zinc transporter ZupT
MEGKRMTVKEGKTTLTLAGAAPWLSGLIPLAALGLMLSIFIFANPLALFTADLPPIETLSFDRIRVSESGFETTLTNGGPDPVTVAQVLVDEAYWQFDIQPGPVIPRLGRAVLQIPYPWVETEPHEITVITATGATFHGEVPLATLMPQPGLREFAAYGLLGVYVGIIPVVLGMLWFPAMKRLGRRWLGAVLALTIGLLVFLIIDTLLEALEVGEQLPGVLQGIPLVFFAAALTWLVLLAVGARRQTAAQGSSRLSPRLYLATLIALGIGLHNMGEGMAIGAAFALGEAALGSFLVIGFTLHNITEGVGIVAPLLPDRKAQETSAEKGPGRTTFFWLAILAGSPAIVGAWLGGFAFSPLLATLFLGIGVGAIFQVIVEVGNLLRRYANQEGTPLVSWINLAGFSVGIGIMYLTALLVKF